MQNLKFGDSRNGSTRAVSSRLVATAAPSAPDIICTRDQAANERNTNVSLWDVASICWIDAKQRMYGPAARRKMISELGEREKLHQCIRPLEWSSSRSGPRWVSARIQGSLPERLLRAKSLPSLMAAPGRPFVHLFMSSSRPRREAVELCLVYCASFAACRVT